MSTNLIATLSDGTTRPITEHDGVNINVHSNDGSGKWIGGEVVGCTGGPVHLSFRGPHGEDWGATDPFNCDPAPEAQTAPSIVAISVAPPSKSKKSE